MTYASEVAADSPIALWHLDETSGTTFADSSGNGHTLTISGSPTKGGASAGAGITGTSVTFPSGSTCASIANPSSWLGSLSNYSIELWFKTTATSLGGMCGQFAAGTFVGFPLVNDGDGTVEFDATDATGADTSSAAGGASLNNGAWHHLVGTYTASDKKARLYVDGSLITTGAASTAAIVPNSTAAFVIGGIDTAGTYPLTGSLDEVAIYGTALSLTRIAAHYAAGTAAPAPHSPVATTFAFAGSNTSHAVKHSAITSTDAWAGVIVSHAVKHSAITGTTAWATGITSHKNPHATTSGTVVWAGIDVGHATTPNSPIAGTVLWSGAIVGHTDKHATVTGGLLWAGVDHGHSTPHSPIVGTTTWTTAITSHAVKHGTTSSTVLWAGSAVGHETAHATVSTTFTWATAVTSHSPHSGAVSGTVTWAGAVSGDASSHGVVTVALTWTPVLASHRPPDKRDITLTSVASNDRWASSASSASRWLSTAGTDRWTSTASTEASFGSTSN